MFEIGLCSHLVKQYQLPGMATKSKTLFFRRRIQTKNADLEMSVSDDELNDQLEAIEFHETQFELNYHLNTVVEDPVVS